MTSAVKPWLALLLALGCASGAPKKRSSTEADATTAVGDVAALDGERMDAADGASVLADGARSGADTAADVTSDGPAPDRAADAFADAGPASRDDGAAGPPSPDAGIDVGSDGAQDASLDSAPAAADASAGQWVKLATPGIEPVHALVVDPSGVIFTGSTSGLRPGTFGGPDIGSPGIFRSGDGGDSWTPASRGLFDYGVAALAAEGSDLFAAASDLMRSRDGGLSWTSISRRGSSDPFTSVAVKGGLLMAAVKNFSSAGLIRSVDGGENFTTVVPRERVSDLGAIGLRPPLVLIAHEGGMQRSTDSGLTFVPVTIGSGPTFFLQFRQIAFADDNTVYATLGSGLQRSTDAGLSWMPVTVDPDATARVNTVAAAGQRVVVGGARGIFPQQQGLLRQSMDGGRSWQTLAIRATSEILTVNLAGDTILAGGSDGLQRSTDGGQTWSWANGGEGPPARSRTVRLDGLTIDDTAHAVNPDGDLYALIRGAVWRSTDGAASWKKLSVPAAPASCAVLASGAILCGGYRSIDHGDHWVEMQFIGSQRPLRFAGRGPAVYAVAGGHPWRSEDDGLSWAQGTEVDRGATNLAVSRDGTIVYHGTKRSFDQGRNWQEIGHGVSYVDAEGRLYEIRQQWISFSPDGGTSWKSLNTQFVAGYPSTIGALAVAGDRVWLQVHNSSPGRDRVVVGGHAESAPFVTADDGLGHPLVNTFALDRRGRLHAATNGGLYRLTP